ncbi:transposase [Mycobacterium xenopi]
MEASDISEFEGIKSVASKLGISEESLRRWRRKAQVDAGERPGTTSQEHAEIRRLKRELAETRRARFIFSRRPCRAVWSGCLRLGRCLRCAEAGCAELTVEVGDLAA